MNNLEKIKNKNFEFVSLEKSYLTVITLTRNSSKYIYQSITSLISACSILDKCEIAHLIIDGNSSDNTVEIIQKISPSSIILSKDPNGIYDAMNYAISLVNSPYLMYLHSDDQIDEYFLINMLDNIKNTKETSNNIFYGTTEFINDKSEILFARKPPLYIHTFQKKISLIFHAGTIYSTALEKKYPYRSDQGLAADDIHLTIIAQKAKLFRVPTAKYKFRMSYASSTMNKNKARAINHSIIDSLALPRIYVRLFETQLAKRFLMKVLEGKSYWILD